MSSDPARVPAATDSVAAGRRTAELYDNHAGMVYGVCRMLLRDPTEAEDAAQQTFLSAHTALLRGARLREPSAWLATIARNECRSRIGARMREPLPLDADRVHDVPDSREVDIDVLGSVEIRAALAELPARQQEAVVLRDVFGLRYIEVGAALGASIPAVEALLVRARRTLRGRLRPVLGSALVLPESLRDGLETALPGFARAASGGWLAGLAAIGGAFAKLTGGPTAAKLAATVVTVGAVGTAAVVGGAPVHGSSRALDRTVDPAPLGSEHRTEGAPDGSSTGHGAVLAGDRSWRTAARSGSSSRPDNAVSSKRADSDGPSGSRDDGSTTPARDDPPEPDPEPSDDDDDGSQGSGEAPEGGAGGPAGEEPSDDDSSGPGSGDDESDDRSGPGDRAEEPDDDSDDAGDDDAEEHGEDGSPPAA